MKKKKKKLHVRVAKPWSICHSSFNQERLKNKKLLPKNQGQVSKYINNFDWIGQFKEMQNELKDNDWFIAKF